MAGDRDDFLRRWSRRKQDAAARATAAAPLPAEAPPALPPLDSLTFESDFKAFMHAKVEEGVKRAALKKLFADPRFNVIDQMDIYIDDYTNLEGIPQEMLAKIEHARATLFGPRDGEKADDGPQAAQAQAPDVAQAEAPIEAPEGKTDDGAAG